VHDLLDLGILDPAQIVVADLMLLVLGARLLDALGAQQAANLVSAEWRSRSLHGGYSLRRALAHRRTAISTVFRSPVTACACPS
jgi:hypothetical protein